MTPTIERPVPMRLLDRLGAHASAGDHRIAYRDVAEGTSLSYRALFNRAARLAQRLRASSVPDDAVVLICCPNTLDFPVAFLGALAAGCAAFPMSTDSPATELKDVAAHAAVVIGSADVLAATGAGVGISLDELATLTSEDLPPIAHPSDGTRLLLLSSGSTGKPKIVCRSGQSLDAVAQQMCEAIGIGPDDRVLATVPLCHSYGLEHGLLAPLWAGATVHLCRGLDLPLVQRELNGGAITVLPGVPAMYEMLAQFATGDRLPRLTSLRAAYSAGAPLPRSVFDAYLNACGVKVGQLYGATEIGSVTFADTRDAHFDATTVGRGMAGVSIRITTGDDPAEVVSAGREGQVWIAARSMFSGYLDEANSPLVDGYFPTGDIGRLDSQGNLTITGRTRLLIDVGGLKVNPIEVEAVLLQHPAVSGCVVVQVRQSQTVARLKAIVTARQPGSPLDVQELRRFARERLAGYKVPRSFEVRDALPRTSTGKILRHLVQA